MLPDDLTLICARAVDPRLGIVRRISRIALQPGEPPLFVLAATCTRPKYFLRNRVFHSPHADYIVPAGGAALERSEALWRVLGEACERYSAGLYCEDALITATREELGDTALPLEKLIAFAPWQYARPDFPFVPIDAQARLRWAAGQNLTRGCPILVPATLVYLGYEAATAEEVFYPTISTGLAAGRTLQQALLNGLCEVIERDAFMCTWLLRKPPERIPGAALARLLTERECCLLQCPGIEPTVTVVQTNLGIPVVLTILQPHGRRTAVLGAAAHPDMHHAVLRSLLEAFHTLSWSIHLERSPAQLEWSDVHELEDHVRYYLDERHFGEVSWLMSGSCASADVPRSPSADHPALLERAVENIRLAGHEVSYVETTTRDVRDLGFRTVRVLVPGLHPLNVGHDTVHEDTRRLRAVAAHWDLQMPAALNPHPHPFP